MDRLIHMASWGIIYTLFSFVVIKLYKSLLRGENGRTVMRLGALSWDAVQRSDVCVFFILTIVASIRCNVGSDYYNYYNYFNSVQLKYSSLLEVFSDSLFNGYNALSYLVKLVSDNQYIIFAIVAVISYVTFFSIIREESEDCEVSLWCYMYLGFFANSLNIIKQYFAMTFLLMAYFSWKRKHRIRVILFCCLSIIFHYSALIAIILFIIARLVEPTKIMGQLIWIIGIATGILLPNILQLILKIVTSASGYEKYIFWNRNDQIRLQLAVVGSCIVYTILLKMILGKIKEIKDYDYEKYREITFLFLGLLINIVGIRMWIIARVGMYFNMMYIVLLPTYLQLVDDDEVKKTRMRLQILLFVYSVFISIFLGENEYYSYSTIFETTPMTIPNYNALHGFLK